VYGSEGSQNLHIKIDHNGGTKTRREKLAFTLVEAFAAVADGKIIDEHTEIPQEVIDTIDLNLPPGILTRTAQKSGLLNFEQLKEFDEISLLQSLNRRLAPKFR